MQMHEIFVDSKPKFYPQVSNKWVGLNKETELAIFFIYQMKNNKTVGFFFKIASRVKKDLKKNICLYIRDLRVGRI